MSHRRSPASGILGSLEADFRALATTIVPEAAGLDATGWRAMGAAVDEALASRPESLRRQFRLFIRLLAWLSVARYRRSLTTLDARRRESLLVSLQRSRLLLVRRGFWGLRVVVFLGYWTRPEAVDAIGYRARPEGWGARR